MSPHGILTRFTLREKRGTLSQTSVWSRASEGPTACRRDLQLEGDTANFFVLLTLYHLRLSIKGCQRGMLAPSLCSCGLDRDSSESAVWKTWISFLFQGACLLFLSLAPQVPSKDTSVCWVVTDLDLDPISDSLQRSTSSVISPKIAIIEQLHGGSGMQIYTVGSVQKSIRDIQCGI